MQDKTSLAEVIRRLDVCRGGTFLNSSNNHPRPILCSSTSHSFSTESTHPSQDPQGIPPIKKIMCREHFDGKHYNIDISIV